MSELYPNPCNNCGFCCMVTPCPVAMRLITCTPQKTCPALEWSETNPNESRCGLIANPDRYLHPDHLPTWKAIPAADKLSIMGVGAGCCIKARVQIGNSTTDFASLSPEAKVAVVQTLRQ